MTAAALSGLLTGLSLIIAIGAQNAFVLRQGIRREHVLTVVLVCALADATLITGGVAGLGAVVTANPVLLTVTRYAGAAFLLVVGLRAAARVRRSEHLDPAVGSPAGRRGVLGTALALTLLNPHVYLDTVVLLGSLANQHGPVDRWGFAAGAVTASVLWFTGLGFGAHRLRPVFARPRSWQVLDAAIALVMVAIAVSLVL